MALSCLSLFQTQMQRIAELEEQQTDIIILRQLYDEKNRCRISFRDEMYKLWTEYNENNTYCSLDTFGKCITDILNNQCTNNNEKIYCAIRERQSHDDTTNASL